MNKTILFIYDYFKRHRLFAWTLCITLTIGLILSLLTLHYKEDISDFLPLDEDNHTALSVYQDISGANKIYALISTRDTANVDPQELADGVETLVEKVAEKDSLHFISNIVKEIDMEKILGIADAVYENIPYFLTDADYARMDSLLSLPDYIPGQIDEDKQMLLFPSSNMVAANISRDPLQLFSPVVNRLSGADAAIAYETYDGYILSPDSKRAIVILESSFGANESEHNADLVALLNQVSAETESVNPNLDIHFTGGPVIAVGNANQIKSDSILAVCIAGILILALLIYVFRNVRNILLIVVSVGWGWLFAMGVIGLFYSSVSIIVIGIASVILGIAVNYPLHLIDHLKDSTNPRAALKEIISPLVVGNVTTVGAFLCLVPLNAPALHDLGLFASLLLVGTILFVLSFLPQAVRTRKAGQKKAPEPLLITRIAGISLENSRWAVGTILILTMVFGYFSLHTEFDSDMRNINFMTEEQRADMAYFQQLMSKSADKETLYVVSSGSTWDDALAQNDRISATIDSLAKKVSVVKQNHVSDFLTSKTEQKHRIGKWMKFIETHKGALTDTLYAIAGSRGFNPEAFTPFNEIISSDYAPVELDNFEQLLSTAFMGNISEDPQSGRKSIVQTLEIDPKQTDEIKSILKGRDGFKGLVFDVRSMNASIADTLSNDFNYIGFVCGFIVFVFLWISLGSIELAIVSFIPMAVSWIWILGIMGILGIKFNIVNIILATFIFGQGDDYTIFMTEGLSYELAYRKKLLAAYKNSIVVSALIMFIGIGTLIFARHPALRSLGEVTVVGMLSVVIMAYLFPPLIFNWLVRKNGSLRKRPITLKKILCTGFCAAVFLTQLFTGYIMGFFLLVLTRPTPRKQLLLHRYCCSVFRWDVKRMPGLRFRYENNTGEDFKTPAVIISNHQSLLDSFYLMTLTPKMVMIANDHVGTNKITGRMFRWLGFITVGMGIDRMVEKVRPYVEEGYSVALFPEGERPRNASNFVKRFHKGMIQFANDLGLDILPVYLHGIVQAMPKGSSLSNGGEVVVQVGTRIPLSEIRLLGITEKEQVQEIRKIYQNRFTELCRRQSTVALLCDTVYDRYRYKGYEIERAARKALKVLKASSNLIENLYNGKDFLVIDCASQGELVVMLALMYPERNIFALQFNEDSKEILDGCIRDFVGNVTEISLSGLDEINRTDLNVFIVSDDKNSEYKTRDSDTLLLI